MESTTPNPRYRSVRQAVAMICGAAVSLLGVAVLVGWHLDSVSLTQVMPSFSPMHYNTALGMVLSGLALIALTLECPRITAALVSVPLVAALLTLVEHIFGAELGLDQLLFRSQALVATSHPGRMSPITAMCFVFIAAAVILLAPVVKREPSPARQLAVLLVNSITIGLCTGAVTGYLTGLTAAYGWGQLSRIAIHTAVAFIALGTGVFAVALSNPARIAAGKGWWIAAPVAIGSLTLTLMLHQAVVVQDQNDSLKELMRGDTIHEVSPLPRLTLTIGLIVGGLLSLTAGLSQSARVRAREAESANRKLALEIAGREQVETELRESENRYKQIVEQASDIIYGTDRDGRIVFFNPVAKRILKYSDHELLGRNYAELVRPDQRNTVERFYGRQLIENIPRTYNEVPVLAKDGTEIWLGQNVRLLDGGAGFHAVARDVTERTRIEAELERTRDAALESTRLKGEFLANMSHEIRTPMNGIIGMTELLLETELTSEQREFLESVRVAGDSLLSLINDILDFSKIEAGKLDFETIDFSVKETIEEVITAFSVQADRKGLSLTCDISGDVPNRLTGDPGRLRQVLVNLVNNAIKFTDHGRVELGVTKVDESGGEACLRFEVRDTGPGIRADQQRIIFDAFTQGDGSTRRRHGGTGLGLAICRRLVKGMRGRISVRSAEGEGSTFQFTAIFETPTTDELRPMAAEADCERLMASRRPLRILIAEDNPVNQQVASTMLTKAGHRVVVASGGREAVTAFQRDPFDIILMDVQMPEVNGFEATAEIRRIEQETGTHTPIVAMTAHAMSGDRERCISAGMDDYLAKPIRKKTLLATIDRAVRSEEGEIEGGISASRGADRIIDRSALLDSLSGDVELLKTISGLFLTHSPELVDRIRDALAAGDCAELERAAHSLKGSVSNFFAPLAVEAARNLESIARAGNLAKAADAFVMLEQELDRIRPAITSMSAVTTGDSSVSLH